MKENFENVTYYPWVGKDYANGGIFGKKILALGESHYRDDFSLEDCLRVKANDHYLRDTTSTVISDYLEDNNIHNSWETTFKKFERLLTQNKNTNSEGSKAIWNSILFYNYLQQPLPQNRKSPLSCQFDKRTENAFFEILDEHKPNIIIVWGQRLWYNMTSRNCIEPCIEKHSSKGHKFEYCTYCGNIKCFKSNHPSSAISYEIWFDIYESMLKI